MRNNDHASNIESRGASLRSAYVCRPCEVLEFVQIEGQEPFVNVRLSTHFEMLPEQRDADLTYVEQSAILEVPIAYLSTQQYAVTIPIQAGDRGMLLFADTSLDNWLLKDEPTVSSSRSHNKNDAIFVPGLWPRPKPLHNYSQDKLTLRTLDNTSSVTISQDGEIRLSAATILKLNAPIIEINGVQMETMNPGYPATFIFVPPGVPDEAEEVSRP